MRILYVSPYPPARDGIGAYTRLLTAAMRDRGCDVGVLLPRPAAESPPEVLGTIGWLSRHEAAVRACVAEFGPDIVHLQFAVPAFGLRTIILARRITALRRNLGVPVVATMHEVTRDTARLRGFGRAIYRSIADSCDTVIVHTQAASKVLADEVGLPQEKIAVIPHPAARPPAGVAEVAELRDRFGLGNARVLLAFGFVHVDKGLQDLVQSISVLRRSGAMPPDDLRVVIAGAVRRRHGPFRAFEARDHLHLRHVLWLARRHGVRAQLILTGYVPDPQIVGWFQMAEAVVLPYRRIEQSGVAGLALALGVPVLASCVGGLAEQFAGSPWTFAARDPAGLADVLARFLATPADRRNMTGPVTESADVTAVAAITLKVYAAAMQHASGKPAHVG